MLLRKASARLVEPMDVQRRAKLNKKLKPNEYAQTSILSTENDYKKIVSLRHDMNMTMPAISARASSIVPLAQRRAFDLLHTPEVHSVATAHQYAGSRNITAGATSLEDNGDLYQEIVSMPTRAAAREIANDSPLQFRGGNKDQDRVPTDISDVSLLQLNKKAFPSMRLETEEKYHANMRRTLQHRHFGDPPRLKVYPKNFSPRRDVRYLFEEESNIEKLKRKLYEEKPFESRFTAKLQNYAMDFKDMDKIQDNLIKYLEVKHDMSNQLL